MSQLMEAAEQSTVLGTPARELAFRVHTRHNVGDSQVVMLSGQKVSVGADPGCTLRLAGVDVAPCYCLVLRGEAHDVVRSMSPRARLNGAEFQDASLQSGDRLQLDEVELEVLPSATPDFDRAELVEAAPRVDEQDAQRLAELEARQKDVERREQAGGELEGRLSGERTALELWRNELEQQKQTLEQARQAAELSARTHAAEQERSAADLSEQQSQNAAERASLKGWRSELEQQKNELEAQQSELTRLTADLEPRRQELERLAHELEQKLAAAELSTQSRADEAQRSEAELNERQSQNAAERASLKGWRNELEQQKKELDQRLGEADQVAQAKATELERRAAMAG